jgi:uncharacterized membrane protein YphA (DoxX/SURF4 family)
MTKEQFLGTVRHALTFLGGILIMNGLLTESVSAELSGAILTLAGGIWSIIKNIPCRAIPAVG